jgi:hypothetical protein
MKKLKLLFYALLLIIILIASLWGFITVTNSDLYGRLTETVSIAENSYPNRPTVRLVLHKLLTDENAFESSLILYQDQNETLNKNRRIVLSATLRDGYLNNPYGIKSIVTLDSTSLDTEPGSFPIASESDRFFLPFSPSINGYPFDDIEVHPLIYLYSNDQPVLDFNFEVQKAFPGRLIKLTDKGQLIFTLTRTPTEKALVIVSSIIFILITSMIVYSLFSSKKTLSTLEELVTLASYLIAVVGFREILGLSRYAGMTALEIAVIGIPLLSLFIGLIVSYFRRP